MLFRKRSRADGPDEACVAGGAQYRFLAEWEPDGSAGAIWSDPGVVSLRYGPRAGRSGHSWKNPFGKPAFVVRDLEDKPVLSIRRASFVPPRFDIHQADRVVGRVSLRTPFRNRYRIDLEGSPSWTFEMPLFTVYFRGESDAGSHVWVIVGPTKWQWDLLFDPGADDARLVCALAFVHNEWWNYG